MVANTVERVDQQLIQGRDPTHGCLYPDVVNHRVQDFVPWIRQAIGNDKCPL